MLDKLRKIISNEKGLLYITIGNLVSSAIGAIIWLVLASLIQPEEYGRINYYIAIGFIGGLSSLIGLNTATTTYIAKGNREFLQQAGLLVVIVAGAISTIVLLLTHSIPSAIVLLGIAFSTMYTAKLLGERQYRKYMFIIMGQRGVQIALLIPLYYFAGIDGPLYAFAIGWFAFGIPFLSSVKRLSFEKLKDHWTFMLHSYSMEFVRSINLYIDKLLIAPVFGFAILGGYQFATQFFYFLVIMGPQTMYSYLLPKSAAGEKNKHFRSVGFGISIFLATLNWFVSPILVKLVFPAFSQYTSIIQLIGLGVIPLTISTVMSTTLLGSGRSRPVFIASLIFLGIELSMLLILGSTIGIIGLAISYVIALCCEATFLFIVERQQTQKS